MLKLLRSGDEGPYCKLMKKIKDIFNTPDVCQFQPCHGRTLETLIIIAREINLPWVCGETNPALFWTSMIKSAYLLQYFCAIEFKTASKPYN